MDGPGGCNGELLLALMRDEQGAQFLCVRVDVEAKLVEDGEPDIFRTDGEVVVPAVGGVEGVDETVAVGCDMTFGERVGEGALDDLFALAAIVAAGVLEEFLRGGAVFPGPFLGAAVCGSERDGHFD